MSFLQRLFAPKVSDTATYKKLLAALEKDIQRKQQNMQRQLAALEAEAKTLARKE